MPANVPAHLRRERLFPAGRLMISAAAQEALRAAQQPVETLIARHCAGDFGEVSSEDANENMLNIQRSGKVTSIFSLSGYLLGLGRQQLWILSSISEGWTYVIVESEVGGLV